MIDDYEHALRLDPAHDKARLALAELYLKAHRQEDAAREYTTHLKVHPDDPEACLGLGKSPPNAVRTKKPSGCLTGRWSLLPVTIVP